MFIIYIMLQSQTYLNGIKIFVLNHTSLFPRWQQQKVNENKKLMKKSLRKSREPKKDKEWERKREKIFLDTGN